MTNAARVRFARPCLACAAMMLLVASTGRAAEPQAPPQGGPPRTKPIDRLEKVWPSHPEWVAMLVDILDGSQLGPHDGWFRKAQARSRYRWPTVQPKFDRNQDGTIDREEFPGDDGDFRRLDRDRDGVLSPPDFDFTPHALTPSPGMMLFMRADRDGNGKLTREEFEAFFKANDSGDLGFLSLGDLQAAFTPPAPPRRKPGEPEPDDGPTRLTLVRGLFGQEIGSLQPGPELEDQVPDFTLRDVENGGEVTLSHLIGPKPVILIFGNFTCGPFRSQAGNVEKLYRRYKDRANFVMVYVREAHPTDGWQMTSNERVGVALRQPRDFEERKNVASVCRRTLGLGFPVLVDTMDDRVGARYSGMPSRLYLVDGDGKVAYKSGRGPFGFKPAELEQALLWMLNPRKPAAGGEAARPHDPK